MRVAVGVFECGYVPQLSERTELCLCSATTLKFYWLGWVQFRVTSCGLSLKGVTDFFLFGRLLNSTFHNFKYCLS
jgi:hypothetical protein